MKEINSCPFCGCKLMTVMKDDVSHKRYVQCLNKDCCARGSQRRTAVKAVSAWNELSEKTIRSMSMKEVISIICRLQVEQEMSTENRED